MFSPRLLAVFAVLAAAAAFPASDKEVMPQPITTITDEEFSFPWMNISPFSLFAPLWKLIPSFADIGPRIYADDTKFQVVVNVKDYRKKDLKVKVKGDFIFVQGSQEAKQDDRDVFAANFFHSYSKPGNSSSADVTAKLTSDGYLVVTAPVSDDFDAEKETDRDVPIVETNAPYMREEKVEKTTVQSVEEPKTNPTPTTEPSTTAAATTAAATTAATTTVAPTTAAPTTAAPTTAAPTTAAATAAAEEEETKEIEATTLSEPEEVTEKDNVIPHGNEIPL